MDRKKKGITLHNIVFPLWMIWWLAIFVPHIFFLALTGNFVIDSLVVLAAGKWQGVELKTVWKQSVFKVWGFGFLADIIGAVIVTLIAELGLRGILPKTIHHGIYFDWREYTPALFVLIVAVIGVAFLIYIFNYKLSFKKLIGEGLLAAEEAKKISLMLAIFTAPYMFLIPTSVFFK